jgi:hypothetical protein
MVPERDRDSAYANQVGFVEAMRAIGGSPMFPESNHIGTLKKCAHEVWRYTRRVPEVS